MNKWKSLRYRKFIRDNFKCCACSSPLILEKETFETHHLDSEGGINPSDQMLCPLCLSCHNYFELNEMEFKRLNGLTNDYLYDQALTCLIIYISSLRGKKETLDFLASIAGLAE